MENQESQDNTQTPQEEIQDVYVLIVREQEEDQTQVVESTRTTNRTTTCSKTHFFPRICLCVSHCFLFFSTLTFQLLLHDEPAQ